MPQAGGVLLLFRASESSRKPSKIFQDVKNNHYNACK